MYCPICKTPKPLFVYNFDSVPVMQNRLLPTLTDALKAPIGKLHIHGCRKCGLVFNRSFNEKLLDYSSEYDATPEYSPLFKSFVAKTAKNLYKRHNLKNKKVVEIGGGKGYFMNLLYGLGAKHIRGFDPAYTDDYPKINNLITKKLFNTRTFNGDADFIISREVLEHIPKPRQLIQSIRSILSRNGTIYLSVPSLDWIIEHGVFFDFIYEHCNYFSENSLTNLLYLSGLGQINIGYGIDRQFLHAEASRGPKGPLSAPTANFDKIPKFIGEKMNLYKRAANSWGDFAIWGVAGKGTSFLNHLRITHERSKYAIDINPNKHNKFVPITGQRVVGPEILRKEKFDSIIVMNPIYEKEIKQMASKYRYRGKFKKLM